MGTGVKHAYEFGHFRLEVERHRLLHDNELIVLPPRAIDALLVLVQSPWRMVRRQELMGAIWPDTFVEDSNLTVAVSQLRKALAESANGADYIETVPRVGYRFVADVREVEEQSAPLIVEKHTLSETVIEEEFLHEEMQSRARAVKIVVPATALSQIIGRHKSAALVTAVILFATVAGAVAYFNRGDRGFFPTGNKAALPIRSIAVLPFTSIDEAHEVLSVGMADALITRFSKCQQITVRPTSATLKYNDPTQDSLAAGRELGVDSVLEGHIQRAGERLRVTVQLLSVSSGKLIWADKFDTDFTSMFKVQDAISEQVAQALSLKLSGTEQRSLTKHYTEDAEAYQLYLRGRYNWIKYTDDSIRRAIEDYQQAIAKDSQFALAYAGIADCYTFGVTPLPPKEAAPKAKAAALKALELDPDLGEAHTSLAFVKYAFDWDWLGAEQEFKRAIELNPNYGQAYHMYAHFLVAMSRFDEALAMSQRAFEIDPREEQLAAHFIWHFNAARQYDRAIEESARALALGANFHETHLFLARALIQKGRNEGAIAHMQKAVETSGGASYCLAGLGYAYAMAGQRDAALKIVRQLQERAKERYVSSHYIAHIFAGLGDKRQALAWLAKAYEERSLQLVYLKVDPTFDLLRSEPDFIDLVRRVGL